jgi:hypothetical protein
MYLILLCSKTRNYIKGLPHQDSLLKHQSYHHSTGLLLINFKSGKNNHGNISSNSLRVVWNPPFQWSRQTRFYCAIVGVRICGNVILYFFWGCKYSHIQGNWKLQNNNLKLKTRHLEQKIKMNKISWKLM